MCLPSYSPKRFNKMAQEVLKQIDKIIDFSPSITSLKILPDLYEALLKALPSQERAKYKIIIPYRGVNIYSTEIKNGKP